eukprot:4934317-Pyramimonas_sp.AAC.1
MKGQRPCALEDTQWAMRLHAESVAKGDAGRAVSAPGAMTSAERMFEGPATFFIPIGGETGQDRAASAQLRARRPTAATTKGGQSLRRGD